MPAEFATIEVKVRSEAIEKLKIELDNIEKQIKRINESPIAATSNEYTPSIKSNAQSKIPSDRNINVELQQLNQTKRLAAATEKILSILQSQQKAFNMPNSNTGFGVIAGAAISSFLRGAREAVVRPFFGSTKAAEARLDKYVTVAEPEPTPTATESEMRARYRKLLKIGNMGAADTIGAADLQAFFAGTGGAVNLDVLGKKFSQVKKWIAPHLGRFIKGRQNYNEGKRREYGLEQTENIDPEQQAAFNAYRLVELERKFTQAPKPFNASHYPDFESPTETELSHFNSSKPSHVNMTDSQAETIRRNQERIDAWRAMTGNQQKSPSHDPQADINTSNHGFIRDESGAVNLTTVRKGINTIGGAIGTGAMKAAEIASGFKSALIGVGFTATAVKSAQLAAPRDFDIMLDKYKALLAKVGILFLPAVRSLGNFAESTGRAFDSVPEGLKNLAGESVLPAAGALGVNWAAGRLGVKGGAIGGLARLAVAHPVLSIPVVAAAATYSFGKVADAITEGKYGATKNPDGSFTANDAPTFLGRRLQTAGYNVNRIMNWFGLGENRDEYLSRQSWGSKRDPALPVRRAPQISGIT